MSNDKIELHCNKCQHETWHEILFFKDSEWSDDEYHVSGGSDYTVAQCRGCESISFQKRSWFSEEIEPDGSLSITTGTYPPKTLRSKPDWYGNLQLQKLFDDNNFMQLFSEIYIAMQNSCRSLAIMGIRALLERIMVENCGNQGTFQKNIDRFEREGFISSIQKTAIVSVLEIGHAAIHRAFEPKSNELISALDITENIIESIYINETKAKRITKNVPKKGKRN